jgi:hypothetical protein
MEVSENTWVLDPPMPPSRLSPRLEGRLNPGVPIDAPGVFVFVIEIVLWVKTLATPKSTRKTWNVPYST